MRTTESTMRKEIIRYMNAGYSLDGAVNQVKAIHWRLTDQINRAADEIENDLAEESRMDEEISNRFEDE